jgi:dienelactone hydrolase
MEFLPRCLSAVVMLFCFTAHGQNLEISEEKVDYKNIQAYLYTPITDKPLPAIIVTGGSEGGFKTAQAMGPKLAQQGFVVLGMAYFDAEGLPEKLNKIPLEQFFHGIDFLQSLDSVSKDKIGFTGGSKGGELALLIASMDARIKAVSAFTPSSVVFQSARFARSLTSSWTYKGEEIPYVPYKGNIYPDDWKDLIHMFNESLTQTDLVEKARIKVENINGAIQLISATKDEIWPSTRMSNDIQKRLVNDDFQHAFYHIAVNTGHGFSQEWGPILEQHIAQFFELHLKTDL